jgi:hypothetical protein
MIKKIEVWFDKYNQYWNVSTYNEENHQYDESETFHTKSAAVDYAKSLLPILVIETRK